MTPPVPTVTKDETIQAGRVPRWLVWTAIAVGFLLPFAVRLGAVLILQPSRFTSDLSSLPHHLFAPGHNLFLVGILNLISFLFFLLVSRLGFRRSRLPEEKKGALISALIAGCFTFLASLVVQASVWLDVFGGHPSSTGAVAFVWFPAICMPAVALVYSIALIAAWSRIHKKSSFMGGE